MGLCRAQLKPGMLERIPEAMASLGMPLTRVEQRANGLYHFYRDPKHKRELAFWTTTSRGVVVFYCGISSSAAKLLEGFMAAGLFEDNENGI
jgi:hypothetical protein